MYFIKLLVCMLPNLYVTKLLFTRNLPIYFLLEAYSGFFEGGGEGGRINLRNFQKKTRKLWNRTTTLKQVYLMVLQRKQFKKPKSVIEINWFVKFKSRLPIPDYSGFNCKPSERNTSLIFLNFSVTFSSGLKSQTSSLNWSCSILFTSLNIQCIEYIYCVHPWIYITSSTCTAYIPEYTIHRVHVLFTSLNIHYIEYMYYLHPWIYITSSKYTVYIPEYTIHKVHIMFKSLNIQYIEYIYCLHP